jgi:serine/threonine protein kinase
MERAGFLDVACRGDEELRVEVEQLLKEHDVTKGLMDESLVPTMSQPPLVGGMDEVSQAESTVALGRIGDYRIERLLGRGGMGSVYQAYEESMHRTVALKVLTPALMGGDETSRFEREAWIAGRLMHPNIVKVYGQGVASQCHYIAMELVVGGSLSAELRKIKETTRKEPESRWYSQHVRKVVSLFIGVADALQHVHENGIVHRDIKPHNLLLTKDSSRLLLTDFGLAHDEQSAQLTRRGDFMGTVRYMSPEQLLAHRVKVDHRTDIWSFGVSLYEALTLELPFSGDTDEAYIAAVSSKEAMPARTKSRLIPRDIETVLMKCLERDPDRRYSSAAELKADLQRFLEVQPVLARRPGPLIKLARFGKRHRATVTAAILPSIFVLSLIVGVRVRNEEIQKERMRWVLQQVIANRAEPESLDRNWKLLREEIQSRVQREPTGELALLARRAAVRLEVSLPSFGLLSDPPELGFGAREAMFVAQRFLFLADLEAALDNGPWKPIGSIIVDGDPRGFGRHEEAFPLTQFYSGLSPVPHSIDFRAVCKLLNPADISEPEVKQILGSPGPRVHILVGDYQSRWPGIRKLGIALFTEVRSVGSLHTTLFKSYPEDFPHKVLEAPGGKAMDTYFHPRRIRIVRLKLQQRSAPGVRFTWPTENNNSRTYCLPLEDIRTDQVIGLELFGHMDSTIPVPLAGNARLYANRALGPLLSFPIAFGLGAENGWYQPLRESLVSGDWAILRFEPKPGASPEDRIQLQDDQLTEGHLDLTPSRSVALGTRWFEYYFARPLSMPMQIEIKTLNATAVDVKSCAPTGR